ncbi:hypothetical protein DFP72DRAFT_1060502 [Ephemerocybe angulata]|uniref:Uncharacterized protein n=1 Tax=Ephemerocybe angulata TaxID=980116 RepID=A0A8H6IFP1_9AGAR|nr:hypothetical protein DFP72DRAFT_1060502 [Tulosesus angulatus]
MSANDSSAPPSPVSEEKKESILERPPPAIPLDERFTEYQLAYLQERRDTYRASTGDERKELCQHTVDHFVSEIEKTGREVTKPERNAVGENVRTWYAQRGRSRNDPPTWTVQWTARQCFYRENMDQCKDACMELYEEKLGRRATSEELDGDEDEDDLDESNTPDPEANPNDAKKVKPFNFFQAAITREMAKLTDKGREKYKKMAVEWRERGPSAEEKKRLAEKNLRSWVRQFSKDVYNQMGARIVFLTAHVDTNDDLHIVTMDFNFELGGGRAFKPAVRTWWEKNDPEGLYGRFVKSDMPGPPGEDGIDREDENRSNDIVLPINKFGEPIIPNPDTVPKHWKPHKWYVKLVCFIVKGFYASAKGIPVGPNNAGPPWNAIAKDTSSFIEEDYLPEGFGAFEDPNIMGVERNRSLLRHWYTRQEQGLVPLTFYQYLSGTSFVAREPREEIPEAQSDSDSDTPPPPKCSRKKPVPKPKKQEVSHKSGRSAKVQPASGEQHVSGGKSGGKSSGENDGKEGAASTGGSGKKGGSGAPSSSGGIAVAAGAGVPSASGGGLAGKEGAGASSALGGVLARKEGAPQASPRGGSGDITMESSPALAGLDVTSTKEHEDATKLRRAKSKKKALATLWGRVVLSSDDESGHVPAPETQSTPDEHLEDVPEPTTPTTAKLVNAASALNLASPTVPKANSEVDPSTIEALLKLLQARPDILNLAAGQSHTPSKAPQQHLQESSEKHDSDVEMADNDEGDHDSTDGAPPKGKKPARKGKGRPKKAKTSTAVASGSKPATIKPTGAPSRRSKEDEMLMQVVEQHGRSISLRLGTPAQVPTPEARDPAQVPTPEARDPAQVPTPEARDPDQVPTPAMFQALEADVARLRDRLGVLGTLLQEMDDIAQKAVADKQQLLEAIVRLAGDSDSEEEGPGFAQVPPFDASSKVFYVILKGRAPGIYSDLEWVKHLLGDLDTSKKEMVDVDSLASARDIWRTSLSSIAFTGRVPGDGPTYGPLSFHLHPSTEL